MIVIQLPQPQKLSSLSPDSEVIVPARKKRKYRKRKKERREKIERQKFENTPVGYLIKHECPLEWKLLNEIRKINRQVINAAFLEQFADILDNRVFKTERFRTALEDFRTYGFRTPNKMEFDLDDELKYIRDRIENKKRLEI